MDVTVRFVVSPRAFYTFTVKIIYVRELLPDIHATTLL